MDEPKIAFPNLLESGGIERAYKICAGKAHTVVLQDTEHTMYVFGDNSSNQLGISSDDDMLVQPVRDWIM